MRNLLVGYVLILWMVNNCAVKRFMKRNSAERLTHYKEINEQDDEERLLIDMFHNYNKLIRPVPSINSTPIIVQFGVAMIFLINVDEKNQVMQTNVWLTLKWKDFQLKWNPSDYGGIGSVLVPCDKVWIPDVVLFNNADGNYEVSFASNVNIRNNGEITWVPPAIYKSSCTIDVEYFPFDEQTCMLIFGSWTYNWSEVQLSWYNNRRNVELNDYSYSGIWDIIDVPGHIAKNGSIVVFDIVIRRKTLFYTVILIIPTVLMGLLSMMVFYLPAECSEKISLSISILLALVVFLLLVSKILPPNSNTIPLMAKYLLMTFVINIMTIMVTVIVINVHYRRATTHSAMPATIRYLFLKLLPNLFLMKKPERIPVFNGYFIDEYRAHEIFDASLVMPSVIASMLPFINSDGDNKSDDDRRHSNNKHSNRFNYLSKRLSLPFHKKNHSTHADLLQYELDLLKLNINNDNNDNNNYMIGSDKYFNNKQLIKTIKSIAFITEHMKSEMAHKKIRDEWKYVSLVIDRLLLITFFGLTLGGTLSIILSAPHVFDFVDQNDIIKKLITINNVDNTDKNDNDTDFLI